MYIDIMSSYYYIRIHIYELKDNIFFLDEKIKEK